MQYFNPDVLYAAAGTTATKEDKQKYANLIGPMEPKLDREVREMLITARVGLLLKASFFGNLATRLKLVNADEWCGTAATDGRHFYYNSRFIKMLKPKEIEFLFGHEVLHCVYDHFGRRGDRDPQIWNIANDFCVNADLVKHRVGEKITTVPCLYDQKYDGMSSEEVYDDLMKNAKKINMSDLIDKLIDEHLDGEGDADGDGDGDGDQEGKGKGRPKLSDAEKQAFRTGAARNIYSTVMDPSSNINAAQRVIGSPEMQRKLEVLFENRAQFDLFKSALERESQLFHETNRILQGSPTARRIQSRERFEQGPDVGAAIADVATGGWLSSLTNMVTRAMRGANMNDEISERVANMLMSKDPTDVAAAVQILENQGQRAARAERALSLTEAGAIGGTVSSISPSPDYSEDMTVLGETPALQRRIPSPAEEAASELDRGVMPLPVPAVPPRSQAQINEEIESELERGVIPLATPRRANP